MRKATATVILTRDAKLNQYSLIELFFNTSKRGKIDFTFSAYFENINQVNEYILEIAKNNGFYIPIIDTINNEYLHDVNYIIVPCNNSGVCGLPYSNRYYTRQ